MYSGTFPIRSSVVLSCLAELSFSLLPLSLKRSSLLKFLYYNPPFPCPQFTTIGRMTRTVSSAHPDAASDEGCVFPQLHQTPVGAAEWAIVEAPQSVGAQVARIRAESQQEAYLVLAALWSVILRRYVESPVTQLWLSRPGQYGSKRSPPEVVTVNIKNEMQFANLLDTTSWTPATPDGSAPPNTGVILAHDECSNTRHDELIEHLSQEVSKVRKNV